MIRPLHGRRRTPIKDTSGQASLEYAIMLTGFLALVITLGAIHSFLKEGTLVTHALESSSHGIEEVQFDTLKDIASL